MTQELLGPTSEEDREAGEFVRSTLLNTMDHVENGQFRDEIFLCEELAETESYDPETSLNLGFTKGGGFIPRSIASDVYINAVYATIQFAGFALWGKPQYLIPMDGGGRIEVLEQRSLLRNLYLVKKDIFPNGVRSPSITEWYVKCS